jgi:transposase-like protein
MNDPVVAVEIVERSGLRIVKINCPYCKKRHTHGGGAVKDSPVLGQRGAHCGKGSYILKLDDSVRS